MSNVAIAVLVVANAPVYIVLARLFFHDFDGFWRALKFVLTPDIISMFRSEWTEDRWASTKFGLWLMLCIAWDISLVVLLKDLGIVRT